MKNIFLIGFMGSGKSTVSKCLSIKLNLKEVDTDRLIEENESRKISEIFEKNGEKYFRQCETNLLKDLSNSENLLISCGGGMVLAEQNAKLMKEQGTVVLLTAKPETILERVQKSTERPILNGNMNINYIEDLMKKREYFYKSAADFVVSTDEKTIDEICEEIIKNILNS